MRLALASQSYPPSGAGGIATQTRLKARGLADLGHGVIVIAHGEDRREETRDGAVRVVRLAAPAGDGALDEVTRWIAYGAAVAAEIARLDAESPLDLVEFPEWAAEGFAHLLGRELGEPGAGPGPESGATRRRIPAVIQLHGPLVMLAHTIGWPAPDSPLYHVGRVLEGTCLRLADAVYSSSATSIEWCAREYGLDGSAWPVLHAGVDTRAFAPAPVPRSPAAADTAGLDGRPTVLFVGKLVPNKGDLLLVEACLRLAVTVPDLRLRMIGGGEPGRVRMLQERAAAFPGLLEIAGVAAREDLPTELGRADVFAAPSRYEGGPGFVYLEAMACGVPVVACAGSGVEETVHKDCGALVPPDDPAALATALERLLRDPALRARLGRRGRERALTVDSRVCVQEIERFYHGVLERASQAEPAAW